MTDYLPEVESSADLGTYADLLLVITGAAFETAAGTTIHVLFRDTPYLSVVLWTYFVASLCVTVLVLRKVRRVNHEKEAEYRRWMQMTVNANRQKLYPNGWQTQ
jgi:hypothetical protein